MQKILFSVVIFLFYTQIFAQFSGGTGTALDPYQVATKADLNNVRNYLSSHFIQTSNIMFDDADFQSGGTYYNGGSLWEPIGTFTGTYDGNNHVIDGIKVNRPSTNSIGVFGHVSGATTLIENLGVSNVNIVGQNYVGGLIGSTIDVGVIIQNCFSTGSINGNAFVGGLVGDLRGGPIVRYSYSTANVAGVTYTGGLVGGNTENGSDLPSISNCYSTGDVTIKSGTDHRNGAFVGENYGGSVTNCYSIGNVYYTPSGSPTDKGFIGNYLSGTISNNFFDEELSNQTTGTGATATTTANMKTQTTFTNAGWDFGTDETDWVLSSVISFAGYPTFRYTGGYSVAPSSNQIASVPNLVWVAENSSRWANNYTQTADLNMWTTPSWDDEQGWTPMGRQGAKFIGTYDGQNYKIENMFINRFTSSFIGCFGYLSGSGANVNNLGLTYVNIKGYQYVGALIGYNESSSVNNSYSYGNVEGSLASGGLIGASYGGNISISYSSVNVNGGTWIGGLIGYLYESNIIENCYASGYVSGLYYIGGLLGVNQSSNVSNCYSEGTVSGTSYVGGLVGIIISATTSNCYSTGTVSGTSYVGGLVGDNSAGTVLYCFWDTETSGTANSAAGTGRTTAEMKTMSTFSDWNFSSIWDIQGDSYCSYPYLQVFNYDTPGTTPEVNPIPGLGSSEVWVNSSFNSGTTGWGVTHFNDLATALSMACPSAIVNISNYSHTGNVDMTGRTFIIGDQDFNLTGNLSGGLIQASGTGKLRMNNLAANTTKTFPITDGTYDYTMTVTTANNTNPYVSVRISDVDPDPAGSINSDFWGIEGTLNLNATVTLKVDKAAIAPKTLNTNSQLRYFDGTKYTPVNGNNFSIEEFDTYYIITLTGVNEF